MNEQQMRQKKTITPAPSFNKAKIVRGGKEYFDLLINLIGQATESIHLQTYIFDDDTTGSLVTEALKAAARKK
ncbi:MAG: hypothetical protein IPI88_07645 [Chitinophagaceae bacterium]|nr:hypothetical protein [Chitinophagaceae bacterium]